jgi:hypothetical protein
MHYFVDVKTQIWLRTESPNIRTFFRACAYFSFSPMRWS